MPTKDGKISITDWQKIAELKNDFKYHEKIVNDKMCRLDDTIINIRGDIEKIMNNHLAHIQQDVNHLKTEFTGIKTDVSWLKKNQWYIMTASVGTLLTVLAGVILLLIKLK